MVLKDHGRYFLVGFGWFLIFAAMQGIDRAGARADPEPVELAHTLLAIALYEKHGHYLPIPACNLPTNVVMVPPQVRRVVMK